MRIRFFNTFEPVNTLYEDVVPELVRRGHEVTIVASRAAYRQGRDIVERYGNRPGIALRLVPSLGVRPDGPIRKLWVHGTYAAGAALASLTGPRTDVNVFLTQPPFFGIWAVVLQYLRGQRFCCATMDLYPAGLVARTGLTEQSPLIVLLNRLSVFYLQRAHSVMVLGRCMKARMQAMGVTRKIEVIPYWINQHTVNATESRSNPMRRALGWSDRFVVYYGGNFGDAGRLDDLLQAAHRLQNHDQILFVLMGSGKHEVRLRAILAAMPGANVIMLPFMHHKYPLSTVLGASDVHFISYGTAHTGVGVPTKAYAGMSAGRALIFQGSAQGEVALLIREHGIGIAVRDGDIEALCEAILRLFRDPERRAAMGQAGRCLAATTHSVEHGVRFFCERIGA
jgi:colanic acid biosynthesis glycosyl transferase WcaI